MEKFTTHIRPPSGFSPGFRELWQYRELFYFFTWRDIKVKYKQTALGILWALLQPLGMMLIFTLIFSRTLNVPSGNLPYPIFVLSGLILWSLFHSSVTHAAESMIQHGNIIKKIYFPRLIIPCSVILTAFFDFLMAFIIFAILCALYGQPVSLTALYYFPAGMVLVLLTAFGAGTFLSALNLKFRDFRYVVPFLMQVLFFSSQVIYPLWSVSSPLAKTLLALNPVNGAIELFRAPLTGGPVNEMVVLTGSLTAALLALLGLYYFRKTESYFADIA